MQSAGGKTWAILLAAGAGRRVRSLTTDASGQAIPKQFWRPQGGQSPLDWALRRAGSLVPEERIVPVVARQHERWWRPALAALPPANVVIQPADRGTAAGVLLPLLAVLERDPAATVVVLPVDHHVADEPRLLAALERTLRFVAAGPERIALLGFAQPEADPESLGWIVPGPRIGSGLGSSQPARVRRFVEKPDTRTAKQLRRLGALANGFLFAASAARLLRLIEEMLPELVSSIRAARRAAATGEALEQAYQELPSLDFSRRVLSASADSLSVVPVVDCGWCDLGTPTRLRRFLKAPPITPSAAGLVVGGTRAQSDAGEPPAELPPPPVASSGPVRGGSAA